MLRLLAAFPQEELTVAEAVWLAFVAQREVLGLVKPWHQKGTIKSLVTGALTIHIHILWYLLLPLHSLLAFLSPLARKLSDISSADRFLMEILDSKPAYV